MMEMNSADFELFLKVTMQEEAGQRSLALGIAIEKVIPKVEEEIKRILPEGAHTKDHFFRKLVDETNEMLGYLWFGLRMQIEKSIYF